MNLFKSLFTVLFISLIVVVSFAQKTVPDIEVKTLEGKSVSIQEYLKDGKATVISFWATWCSPCKKELNTISDVYEEWQEEYNMKLLAITIDNSRAIRKVKPMVDGFQWEFEVLSDVNEDLKKAMNFQTVPQTFVVDKDGNIVYSHSGYSPGDESELEDILAGLIAEDGDEEKEEVKKEKKKKNKKKKEKDDSDNDGEGENDED